MSGWPTTQTETKEVAPPCKSVCFDEALGAYFAAIAPLAVAEWRLSLRLRVVPPSGHTRCEVGARDLSSAYFPWNEDFESHRINVSKNRTYRLRSGHLQPLAVVRAYQDGVIIGDAKLNTDKRPDYPPL